MGTTKERLTGTNIEKLTDKERAFILEYMIDHNGKRAAIAAGYAKKNAASQASQLLQRPRIKKALGKYMRERNEERKLSIEATDQKLADSLFRDLRDFFDENGIAYSNPNDIPERAFAFIDGFECYQHFDKETGEVIGQTIKWKWSSSDNARDMSYKRQGAYAAEKHDHRSLNLNANAEVIFDWNQLGRRPVPDPIKDRLDEEKLTPEERKQGKLKARKMIESERKKRAKEDKEKTKYSVDELFDEGEDE